MIKSVRPRIAGIVCPLLLLATFVAAAPASAVSLQAGVNSGSCTDMVNSPDDFLSWDPGPITWRMDDEFLDAFPDPRQHQQVRLAFQEWEAASSNEARRHAVAPYSFVRRNGSQPFVDLRSVMTHELGHTLGAQHPDACWFNLDMDTGTPYAANFNPDGSGGWVAGPPQGGEIMNESNNPGLPDEKPTGGMGSGQYWRIVSKDELRMLDYMYGYPLDFQEVFGNTDADILVSMHNVGGPPSDNLGVAGPESTSPRDANDPYAGEEITAASVSLNANPPTPIDFGPSMMTWEFTNHTGKSIIEMSLGIFGTDNPSPLSYTGTGGHAFTTLSPEITTSVFQPERIGRFLTDPIGGSIPDGETIEVSLEEDVWDWELPSSNVKATDGTIFPSNLIRIVSFGLLAPGAGAPAPDDSYATDPGLSYTGGQTSAVTGFRIQNSDSPVTITELALAVPPEHLGLRQLNGATLASLRRAGKVITVPIRPITLGPGEEFLFVLDGDPAALSEKVRAQGNFTVLGMPELAERELMVAARAVGEHASVGAFTLVNRGPNNFLEVAVDVKPRDAGNRISCSGRSRLSVAILSTDVTSGDRATFDASKVDPASVALGAGSPVRSAKRPPASRLNDVDQDGDQDLVVTLPFQGSGLTCQHTRVTVSGETNDGQRFVGHQAVRMVRR